MAIPFNYFLIILFGYTIQIVSCNYSEAESNTNLTVSEPISDQKENTNTMEKITVKTSADIAPNNGKHVYVFGKYIEVDVRKRKTDPPYYAGHVAIQLEDGKLIYLFPPHDKKAIRSQEEIDLYKDQDVIVRGFLAAECRPPKEPAAYMKVPCLEIGIVIMSPKMYEFLEEGKRQNAQ